MKREEESERVAEHEIEGGEVERVAEHVAEIRVEDEGLVVVEPDEFEDLADAVQFVKEYGMPWMKGMM